jgi:hypothetical protein
VASPHPASDPATLAAAAGAYLRWLVPTVKAGATAAQVQEALAAVRGREAQLEGLLAAAREELERMRRQPGLRLQAAAARLPLVGGAARAVGRVLFGRRT